MGESTHTNDDHTNKCRWKGLVAMVALEFETVDLSGCESVDGIPLEVVGSNESTLCEITAVLFAVKSMFGAVVLYFLDKICCLYSCKWIFCLGRDM